MNKKANIKFVVSSSKLNKKANIKFSILPNKLDKRGEETGFNLLGYETVRIILAVICILFLVIAIVSIYNNKVNNEGKEYAKADLQRIQDIISSLEEGQYTTQDLVNPKGWYLMGFTGYELKPNLCIEKNCLCICKREKNSGSKQAEQCDKVGECVVVENLKEFSNVKIIGADRIRFIRIKKENGFIFIGG